MNGEYLVDTTPKPILIGAQGMDEIEQNIRLIIATRSFSVRLDCPFAGEGSYIDSPLPHATALRMAEVMEAVEKYEPRVNVLSVSFEPEPDAAMDGILFPRLRFTLKDGVSL